jgi:uncharacterized protein (DUF433 family)
MTTLLGKGVYSFSDAARLTRLRTGRVREWFVEGNRARQPVFRSDYRKTEEHIISFLDLVEVFVAGQLRDKGISLQTIRKVQKTLSTRWGTPHPFCREEVATSGKSVFILGLDERGRTEVEEVLTKQRAFPEIIEPFLNRLDYDSESLLAARWRISSGVVVDPEICFGQPIVESTGIPTLILANAYKANGENLEVVANWYGVTTEDVRYAVDFEGMGKYQNRDSGESPPHDLQGVLRKELQSRAPSAHARSSLIL